jgi:hypothetical protein
MMMPSWIQPANPAAMTIEGVHAAMAKAAQEAAERFREMQTARQEQESAQADAKWQAEWGLRAAEAARKASTIQTYQKRVAAGEDPVNVMMELGPGMGEAASVMGPMMRNRSRQPAQVPMPDVATSPQGNEYAIDRATGKITWGPAKPRVPGTGTPASTTAAEHQKRQDELAAKRFAAQMIGSQLSANLELMKSATGKRKEELADKVSSLEKKLEGLGGPTSAPPADDASGVSQGAASQMDSAATMPQAPTQVRSKEQFDALPSGSVYVGTDGKKYRKP